MRHTKPVRKTTEEDHAWTCDRCLNRYDAKSLDASLMHHLSFVAGFGSEFEDNANYELDLCEHCVVVLLGPLFRKATK